jgi:crotonobetainyl-CoA:carnitine CoA-transferase CaiB-like acyl-CoA transferase
MKLLDGIKVVELGTVLAVPSVGMFLAELGAEVIKIEPPGLGDVTRTWKNSSEAEDLKVSAYFCSVNWGKKMQRLDLNDEEQARKAVNLCLEADIVLSNFKPAAARKFGLDQTALLKENPAMIYAHLYGFRSEPDRVAYDTVLQAETGYMSMNGYPEMLPLKMPVAFMDVLAAHQLKEAILLALYQRQKNGRGCAIEVTLEESAISSLMNQATNYLQSGVIAGRNGSLHPNIAPYGETLLCSDNKYVVLAVGNNSQFEALCGILGVSNICNDPRFDHNQNRVQNRGILQELLQKAARVFTARDLVENCTKQNVPAGVVCSIDEVLNSPVAKQMLLNEEVDGVKTTRVQSVAFRLTYHD